MRLLVAGHVERVRLALDDVDQLVADVAAPVVAHVDDHTLFALRDLPELPLELVEVAPAHSRDVHVRQLAARLLLDVLAPRLEQVPAHKAREFAAGQRAVLHGPCARLRGHRVDQQGKVAPRLAVEHAAIEVLVRAHVLAVHLEHKLAGSDAGLLIGPWRALWHVLDLHSQTAVVVVDRESKVGCRLRGGVARARPHLGMARFEFPHEQVQQRRHLVAMGHGVEQGLVPLLHRGPVARVEVAVVEAGVVLAPKLVERGLVLKAHIARPVGSEGHRGDRRARLADVHQAHGASLQDRELVAIGREVEALDPRPRGKPLHFGAVVVRLPHVPLAQEVQVALFGVEFDRALGVLPHQPPRTVLDAVEVDLDLDRRGGLLVLHLAVFAARVLLLQGDHVQRATADAPWAAPSTGAIASVVEVLAVRRPRGRRVRPVLLRHVVSAFGRDVVDPDVRAGVPVVIAAAVEAVGVREPPAIGAPRHVARRVPRHRHDLFGRALPGNGKPVKAARGTRHPKRDGRLVRRELQ